VDKTLEVILLGALCGVIFGIYIHGRAEKDEKTVSGPAPKALNFLASCAFGAIFPSVIVGLIVRAGFGIAFPVAMGFLVISLVILFFYSLMERPARALVAPKKEGWTEEDARSSGL
jgi:glucose uptake protein GlcU